MNTNTIRKFIAAIALTAIVAGCGTTGNRSDIRRHAYHDVPRGQIGHIYAVSRSDAPRGQIGQVYAVNTIRVREHILPDDKRCV